MKTEWQGYDVTYSVESLALHGTVKVQIPINDLSTDLHKVTMVVARHKSVPSNRVQIHEMIPIARFSVR